MEHQLEQQYDIAIVGSGTAGYSAALRAAELGKSVVMVERDGTLGGTCLNRGCIPSKALITATRTIADVEDGARMGIMASVEEIDFGKLREFRDGTVTRMTEGLRGLLAYRGIAVVQGDAAVSAERSVTVSPADGQDTVRLFAHDGGFEELDATVTFTAGDVIVATGSSPRPLPNAPFHGALIDSTQALALNTFPHNAIIIGSGAIALEFASMWNAAGCDVTLLIRKDNVLSNADHRAAVALNRELKRRGITIVKGTQVTGVDTGDNLGATVHYRVEGEEDERTMAAELALVAIGRSPNTSQPWFAGAGIELDADGFVTVDDFGRTSRDHIWAIGDITRGRALAHRAFAQGIALAEHIAGLDAAPVVDANVPNVVFCTPEFATVGLTLAEARADSRYADVRETLFPVMANARMVMAASGGSFSIVSGRPADGGDELVLGVHVVAPDASDLIAEAQQIVADRIPLHQAASQIHPHPTFSEIIGETLLKADGRPLHTR
ncbi:dihydrolipoyl dehydrogenase [Bifidobacterium cuniculi]|uniref:Dihydrolipoyl dehydrogenase n=1 Tax=Bifidobacterium cuniculi TaxID=1688 RepID=A0A087AQ90_9BIFI|nr:dihydrolipoyl dehydrogenase [Bifidobacterium cuniculi]